MVGALPTKLKVNGTSYAINSDYRVAIKILVALADVELNDWEKSQIVIRLLYTDYEQIPSEDLQEALNKAVWFLDCGDTVHKPHTANKPVYDFEQDEQMIFSSVNKVASKEIRALEYMHFWTFIGLFNEIGEGTFSTIVSIRQKKNKGKKLEKWEQDFYRNNKELIDLKRKYTAEEQAQLDALTELLG